MIKIIVPVEKNYEYGITGSVILHFDEIPVYHPAHDAGHFADFQQDADHCGIQVEQGLYSENALHQQDQSKKLLSW
jgi:hypothetical protein